MTTLVAAVALLVAFVVVESTTTREPLPRLGLLTNRAVTGANAFNLLLGAVMGSGFYFVVRSSSECSAPCRRRPGCSRCPSQSVSSRARCWR